MIAWLSPDSLAFPAVDQAPSDAPLAAGGDLSPERLLRAYAAGIFPWYNEPPILWWSPDPRMALAPADLRINRSLAKAMRRHDYTIRFDSAFPVVIRACAAPRARQPGTWINAEMITAYENLFHRGHAHSVEAWRDGVLVGGLYGVALGGAFFGESMFSMASYASKIAFVGLIARLTAAGFTLIDCQVPSEHMASLGARLMPRRVFLHELRRAVGLPIAAGRWTTAVEDAP
ncbi:leucyl/phenylalanyl-tRNA--protein transferase [Acidiferrobacter thiooxydans]|jgi:leucyl/phenylalanyl-tRNA--protein transferase|uniref:Leucyl/phenylalanyl-tRNA--protein transferase n=1 Tax=Acidiferrobacter thiooxydans TaxID=163359 RepID=A0A1C2G121_9GAMM|nr:leucyl/phenylalanyl-tRNA--protein transferase [Acidiferrobacter thiooxydans]MDA8191899.1 leucyl/phenylalanyl-tRNA--protein transferase [Gammaproteobacteria bacterium]RCN56049.1 leucyl/phenylalanyl-tRNA--protein transferase [Acidiferrobacter thiooxydans]UEN98668.1 leucyl/phenylalanyl-tRNA--protein transferase [Acidiferrobacter thiooxydans]